MKNMIKHVILVAFLAFGLMDQATAYTWEEHEATLRECNEQKSWLELKGSALPKYIMKCFLSKNSMVDDGRIDTAKLIQMVEDIIPERPRRAEWIETLNACAKNVSGETDDAKLTNYVECLHNIRMYSGMSLSMMVAPRRLSDVWFNAPILHVPQRERSSMYRRR